MIKTIRVAAIQLECKNGQVETNLKRASELVEKAAGQGAELVLLPELLAAGYQLTRVIWNYGEPKGGPTESWLTEMAEEHRLWIGTTYLQAEGNEFFNTFALAAPGGNIVTRVHKEKAPAIEAFFFRGKPGPHVIDTPLCRIGVSICFEGWLARVVNCLRRDGAELVLMPHSAPTPSVTVGFNQADVNSITNGVHDVAILLATELGVPTVMANKTGPWKTALPKPFPPQDSSFPGLSAIVDAKGCVLARLEDQEDVLVADIQIDPSLRKREQLTGAGKWARAVPHGFKVFVISEAIGKLSYFCSLLRRRVARKISSRNGTTRRST
jgi:N-carbamoylputrescine amidase